MTANDDIRLTEAQDEDHVTVTAEDHGGNRVGIAWFEVASGAHPHAAYVEVTPTHRDEGVGAHLVEALIAAASARGIATLTWTTPADDLAARRVLEASHAVCARRVEHGRAKSTIFVPRAA
jgi:GNAT superfamily N-acetyltransferase